ncbi:MAG: tetraacyldisaccharide 4'-kinase [Thermodesulfobacteria bacterium]|nr:tetraacyldisaccharide 4'-kinase [Thermodesulfobacteriota bacterium]
MEFLNPYYWGISLRNFLYDIGLLKSHKVSVPVISVGNLSVGGSGKTSLVRELLKELSKEHKVAVVMRGYKRRSKGLLVVANEGVIRADWIKAGDEAFFLAKFITLKKLNACVIVDEDRVRGARKAIALGSEVVILDDGFQHRRIYRDVDVVLLRKKDLSDKLLPFGRLREPLSSLKRATAIVLSYQDVEPFDFSYQDKPVFRMKRVNWRIIDANWKEVELKTLKNKEFVAFCGLGDNAQFLKVLKNLGIRTKKFLSFKDHYDYENFGLEEEEFYITTLKDGVKIAPHPNLYFLDFDVEVGELFKWIKRLIKFS